MLKRLRRKAALIRYYSASRPDDPWRRAADRVLPTALVIAAVTVLALEATVTTSASRDRYYGNLGQSEGGLSAVLRPEGERAHPPPGRPYGQFDLSVAEERCGLLVTTAVRAGRVTINLNLYDEPDLRLDARLGPDAPERLAIEQAMAREGLGHLELPEPGASHDPYRRLWAGTILGGAIWWLIWSILLLVGLRASRVATLAWGARRKEAAAALGAAGRCRSCGYDLRGLEFNERCPECGTLIE